MIQMPLDRFLHLGAPNSLPHAAYRLAWSELAAIREANEFVVGLGANLGYLEAVAVGGTPFGDREQVRSALDVVNAWFCSGIRRR